MSKPKSNLIPMNKHHEPAREQLARFQGKTANQNNMYRSLHQNVLTLGLGSAGTGKTYTACHFAAEQLQKRSVRKIILTRPIVGLGRTNGALPGTMEEKLEPWYAPTINAFKSIVSAGWYDTQKKHGNIELVGLEYVRGQSYDDTIIIVDEAQNLTRDEIKAMSTRVGVNSKIIFIGDTRQSDLKGNGCPIYDYAMLVARCNVSNIGFVTFGHEDIVRSDFVKELVIAFEKNGW